MDLHLSRSHIIGFDDLIYLCMFTNWVYWLSCIMAASSRACTVRNMLILVSTFCLSWPSTATNCSTFKDEKSTLGGVLRAPKNREKVVNAYKGKTSMQLCNPYLQNLWLEYSNRDHNFIFAYCAVLRCCEVSRTDKHFILLLFSVNLPAFYHECCSLICS